MATDLPWDDCKIAFSIDNEDLLWAADEAGILGLILPAGWRLWGTDGAGARFVAIFRVDGVPTSEDGETVVSALIHVGARS